MEYDISTLDAKEHYDTLFLKERWDPTPMSTGETLEQRIIVTFSFKYRDYGSGGKPLCIMPSSTTECGKLEPVSGIASGELRST